MPSLLLLMILGALGFAYWSAARAAAERADRFRRAGSLQDLYLLDDPKVTAPLGWGGFVAARFGRRRRWFVVHGRTTVFGQRHALPRFARVDRQHRRHRHRYGMADAAE